MTTSFSTHAVDGSLVLSAYNFFYNHYQHNPAVHVKLYFDINPKAFKTSRELCDIYQKILTDSGFVVGYDYSDYHHDEHGQSKVFLTNHHEGIVASVGIYHSYDVYIDFFGTSPHNADLIDTLRKALQEESRKYEIEKTEDESYIHFICRGPDGFYTQEFEVSNGIDFANIFDSYEDDFKEKFSDTVLDKLSDMNYSKGIVLLHGAPGTGKTTYLRYLLSKIKKKVMYLPPELGHSISDPGFITFLMSNPNSILCIEDAENIIKAREAGGNQAVSNILNITDGILGSALKYQVICTFNAPFTEIDSALTRKGRMIGEYKFEALSEAKTRSLVEKLYGEGTEPEQARMTLAEIHSMDDYMPKTEDTKRTIGF